MASTLGSSFVDKVRSTVDIVALVSESVPLKRVGRKLRGLCPFHSEKTPSFYVDDAKGLFYCFGCQAGGDAFKFVMLREKMDFLEAARFLARKAGIAILEGRTGRPSEREALLASHLAAAEFYHDVLLKRPEGKNARDYLRSRGIMEHTIIRLQIGFAPDRWDALKGHLTSRGFATPALLAGGLLAQHETKGSTYDRFRNRVMFPIRTLSGAVVGFGGRAMEDGEPKYLNSAESPIYTKRGNLFGLHLTRHGIREAREAVVVEGYFDFTSLLQAGFTHIVATLGTAFSEEQATLLRRFTDQVVINYDPDAAGASATRRGVDLLLAQGFKVRVLRLEAGKDPDLFVRDRGVDAYRAALQNAPRYFEYLLDVATAGKDLSDFEAKSAAVRELLPAISQVPNRIERAGYVNALAERLAISDDVMLAEIRDGILKAPAHSRAKVAFRSVPAAPAIAESEERLVRALLESQDIRAEVLAQLTEEDLAGSTIEIMVRAIGNLYRSGGEISYARVNEVLQDQSRTLLAQVAMRQAPAVSRDEAIGCVASLRLRRLRRALLSLQKQMEAETDSARLDELMRRKMDVSRQINSLS